MPLPGPAVLAAELLSLPPVEDPVSGALGFAGKIGNYIALASGGPTGSPGIITFATPLFANLVSAMPPDPTGAAWGLLMASNFQTALLASIVTPGTVVDPTWTASGVDILTLPSAAASIPTIPLAFASLSSDLPNVKADMQAPMPLANAFDKAIKQLQVICIGLALVGVAPVPVPLPKSIM
jgi:hypothetical protein